MTTTHAYDLNNILAHALQEEKENDSYEFKQQYHKNNVEFIHDIICLANNIRHKGDRYFFLALMTKQKWLVLKINPGRSNMT